MEETDGEGPRNRMPDSNLDIDIEVLASVVLQELGSERARAEIREIRAVHKVGPSFRGRVLIDDVEIGRAHV